MEIDLQLFSEERTEEATPRKLQEARKKGQAPRSADLAGGISLVVAASVLKWFGPSMYNRMANLQVDLLSMAETPELSAERTMEIYRDVGLELIQLVLMIGALIAVAGLMTGLIQGRLAISSHPLKPDFNKLNPLEGIKRLVSLRAIVDLCKALLKLILIGTVAYVEVAALIPQVPTLMDQSPTLGITFVVSRVVSALQMMGLGLVVIGVVDYVYQVYEFNKSLRMTKQEVKQEHKQQEGSPEVKQRQRGRARELTAQRRSLKEVPYADVVLTNPTHFAVALRYKPDLDPVPRVVAKGADLMALQIREIAKQHNVPTVENKPLARSLYATVGLNETVPADMYRAVAEVLSFVYDLRRKARRQELGDRR